jgi:putative SOS response-associated peptidase YedK
MCGRFTLTTPTDEISEYFRILEGLEGSARGRLRPRYNIAPTQPVACVRRTATSDTEPSTPGGSPARELVELRWGLIPHWAKDLAIGSRMINARSESVADKPAYREAFRKRRCLVVADGFYEWKRLEGAKQPYFIHMEDRRPFAFAGLWARWKPRGDQLDKIVAPGKTDVPLSADGRVESCAFLTIGPNELTETIHDRMPVILPRKHWDTWLDPELQDADELSNLLRPYPANEMRAHPVSTHVNKSTNDDPACIEPLKRLKIVRPERKGDATPTPPEQDRLF